MIHALSLHFERLIDILDHKKRSKTRKRLFINRVIMSKFILMFIISGFIISLVSVVLFYQKIISSTGYTVILLMHLIVFVGIGIVYLPFHPEEYGFNLNNLGWNLKRGALAGLLLLLAFEINRFYLVQSGKTEYAFTPVPSIHILYYPLVALIQETVTKGFLQTSFIALFGKNRASKLFAILLSSLLFAVLHIVYGFPVMGAVFIFSIALGFFYEKTRSVVGVTIVHIMSGIGMFFSQNIGLSI